MINFFLNGWPLQARFGHDLQPYFQVRNDISFQRELLLKCNQIVIPIILQKEILNNIHEGCQGITKCRARPRSVWRPGLSRVLNLLRIAVMHVLNIVLILLGRCCNPLYRIARGKK